MYGIYKKEVLMSRSKKELDLTVGDPFRSLLKFAIPVILGNLFQLFYTLADTMIVGKTLGAQSLDRHEKKRSRLYALKHCIYGSPHSDLLSSGSSDPDLDADSLRYFRRSL